MKIALMSFIFLFVVSCSHMTGGCHKYKGENQPCAHAKDADMSKCKDGKCPYMKHDGKMCEKCMKGECDKCKKGECPKCKDGQCPMKKEEATPATDSKKTSSCLKCLGTLV